MRRTELESWETIQCSLENEVRERNGCSQRISYHVRQNTVALEPGSKLRHALRMKKDRRAQFFRLRPKRIELGRSQLLTGDGVANRAAMQPELPDTFFQLLGREVGILQRNRRKTGETIRVGGAEFSQFF